MKALKNSLVLAMTVILISCGGNNSNTGSNTNTNTTTTTNTGSSTASWNSLDAIEESLRESSMAVSTSSSFLYGMDDERIEQRYEFEAIDEDSVRVEVYDVEEENQYDSYTLEREDIIDVIFNKDQDAGRSRNIEILPCRSVVGVSTNGPSRNYQAVQVAHTLENGERIVHLISPQVPLHQNPLATLRTSTSTASWWIFEASSAGSDVTWLTTGLGYSYLYINCQ